MLNIYHIETDNYVNGSGKRFVLWVQGCTLGCSGCWNRQTWEIAPHTVRSTESVFQEILAAEDIDGVTFSGGEPFLQADALADLAEKIKSSTDLTVHVFSGFTVNELHRPDQQRLLTYVDTLVAGRFQPALPNNGQSVYHFSPDRDQWGFNNTDIQIDIDTFGDLQLTGYPQDTLLADLQKELI